MPRIEYVRQLRLQPEESCEKEKAVRPTQHRLVSHALPRSSHSAAGWPHRRRRVPTISAAAADALKLPFETYTMPNGLTVILSHRQDDADRRGEPLVPRRLQERGGGRTGFAHLFEHVMFTGSGNVPYGLHDKLTEGVGGMNNGTTTTIARRITRRCRRTISSRRCGSKPIGWAFLLDSLDLAKLNAQRDIVKNERRQRSTTSRTAACLRSCPRRPIRRRIPYSWSVIGSMEDLSAASEEDVKNFFRLYYAPNNAFLSIVGDFDPGKRRPGSRSTSATSRAATRSRGHVGPVTLTAEKRLVFEDRVQVPRLYIQWPTVGEKNDDATRSTCWARSSPARAPRG